MLFIIDGDKAVTESVFVNCYRLLTIFFMIKETCRQRSKIITPEQFYETYPQQTKKINGKDFIYSYYKNENAESALVLFTGGIGLSVLFLYTLTALRRIFQ